MLFVGVDWVNGPQIASMLWWRIIAGTGDCFEGHTPYQLTRLLGGLSSIHPMCQPARLRLVWVFRAPYLVAAAMVGLVVAPTAVDYCSPGGNPNKLGIDRKLFLRTIAFF